MRKLSIGIAVGLVLASKSAMAACTVPFPNFTAGTTASSSQMNSNFSSITSCAAPLASPSFTGTITAPDGSSWTSTNGLAVAASSGYTVDNTLSYRASNHQVNLNGNTAGNLTLQGDSSGANSIVINNGAASQAISFWAGTQRITLMNNGQVGIGTTSPTSALHVVGGTGAVGQFYGTNNTAYSTSTYSGVNTLWVNNSSTTAGTGSGIGFGVKGLGPGSVATIAGISTASDYSSALIFQTRDSGGNDGERMRITATGNVGIGTTSPGYTLYVNGSAAGPSGFQNVSDARLKKNIVALTGGLALVTQLQPVRFDFRSKEEREVGRDLNLPSSRQIGFIAQDLAKVLPEATAIAKNRDAIMSIAESKIVPVLVAAVQELKASNDNQTIEIERLEAKVSALEGKMRTQTAQK